MNWESEMIQLLLEKGADIDFENSDGQAALHVAADNRHSGGVKLLLS